MNNFISEIYEVRTVSDSPLQIPLFGSSVSCGFPSPADDYLEGSLSLDEHLVRNPDSTFFVRAKGDSMFPLINDGDLLVVDRSLQAGHDQVVLAVLNGEFIVKRLFKSKNELILKAENSRYSDIHVSRQEDFHIWGIIVHTIHSDL